MDMDSGLENVVAAETVLSDVDGAAGQLIIRGHTLDQLVTTHSFEDVVWLLLGGVFDDLPPNAGSALGGARARVAEHLRDIDPAIATLPVFDGLRAAIAYLPDTTTLETGLDLIAAPSVILPMLLRLKDGASPIAPSASNGHAEDMLTMAGLTHHADAIAGLDRYLISVIDHGLNASTFTARVVASTGAGLTSSVLAALGALKGPLHGGAPGPVLDMLDAVGTPGNAEAWVEAELSAGRRLMGFGHRVYRTRDPRADALKGALSNLGSERLSLAGTLEREALAALSRYKPDRKLDTNVEFYTAILLEALGFPRGAFTAVFAAGRTAGWVAHAREQALTGRLIRPASRYVGPMPSEAA